MCQQRHIAVHAAAVSAAQGFAHLAASLECPGCKEKSKDSCGTLAQVNEVDARIFPNEYYSMATVGRLIQIDQRDCASLG